MNKSELMKTANEIRKGAITGVYSAKSGHPGGALSAADIYSYLFFEELNIDPKSRSFRPFQRTCCTWLLRSSCKPWIFPGGRFKDTASHWFLSSGPSGYETYPWC